jgi:hypothetical protein
MLGVTGTVLAVPGHPAKVLVVSRQLWKLKRLASEPIATDPPMLLKKVMVGGAPGAVKPFEATLMTIVWATESGLEILTVALSSSAEVGAPGEVESALNVVIVIGAAVILPHITVGFGLAAIPQFTGVRASIW